MALIKTGFDDSLCALKALYTPQEALDELAKICKEGPKSWTVGYSAVPEGGVKRVVCIIDRVGDTLVLPQAHDSPEMQKERINAIYRVLALHYGESDG